MQLDGFQVVHDGNAGPAELLDGHEGLVQVLVLGDEVRADVNGEPLGAEDVGGGLREVCGDVTGERIRACTSAIRTVDDVLDCDTAMSMSLSLRRGSMRTHLNR